MSYDDELFPGMTPPFSETWVDRTYCYACKGELRKNGVPLDGVYVEFYEKDQQHRHYVRVQNLKGGKP